MYYCNYLSFFFFVQTSFLTTKQVDWERGGAFSCLYIHIVCSCVIIDDSCFFLVLNITSKPPLVKIGGLEAGRDA